MNDGYEQGCPIAVALDVIGGRWSLLLLRDLAHAPLRFTDLAAINPRVSPNLLTKRLRALASPWHWLLAGDPVRNGPVWRSWALPVAVAAALVAADFVRFERRDLR